MQQLMQRTIIVPKRDNDGAALTKQRRMIERQLIELAGGYTRYAVSGAWYDQSDGQTYRDESMAYTVVSPETVDKAIESRLAAWCALLRQEALFTSTAHVAVSYVTASPVAADRAAS